MTRKINRTDIAWGAERNARRPTIPIVSPKPGCKRQCVLLCQRIETVRVHYFDGRTWPCCGSKAKCEGCRRESCDVKWKGFAAACFVQSLRLCIAEITPHAVLSCPALETSEDLRGQGLTLERVGKSSSSPVTATLERVRGDLSKLPPTFDVREELCRIWEGDSKQ